MAKGGRAVRTAVISGGTGGLGRAMATQLQADGWRTILLDLQVSLVLFFNKVLAHFLQVILQQLLVRHAVDTHAFPKTHKFGLVLQRAAAV